MYVRILLHKFRTSPLICFRIPFSTPFKRIERMIEDSNKGVAPLRFFINAARDHPAVDRAQVFSLREALAGVALPPEAPIDLWIDEIP